MRCADTGSCDPVDSPLFTPELEDPAWLRREYVDKGRTAADLARECNTNASTIADYLARAGIPTRGHLSERMPPELRDREWLAANAERSHRSIALDLGVSPKTVTLAMRKAGVESRLSSPDVESRPTATEVLPAEND